MMIIADSEDLLPNINKDEGMECKYIEWMLENRTTTRTRGTDRNVEC